MVTRKCTCTSDRSGPKPGWAQGLCFFVWHRAQLLERGSGALKIRSMVKRPTFTEKAEKIEARAFC